MPRAVIASAYGGPEVFEIAEVPSREPGPEEVVIDVRAAALNPIDAKIALGLRGAKDPSRLPLRTGFEASGVIASVGAEGALGADGTPLRVGDEVLAFRVPGAAASEITVPAKDVLHKPPTLSFEEASGLLLVGVTAAHALETVGVGSGDVLLVHGAAGSVGRAVAQLAGLRGARVVGTAAEHRHDELRSIGVEPVTYGPGLRDRIEAIADRVDAAIDTVGTDEALEVSVALVADRARLVTIANGPPFLEIGGKWIGGGPGADPGTELRNAVRPELVRLAGEGLLRIPVAATYPLDAASEAFAFLDEGHAGGKVVLIP